MPSCNGTASTRFMPDFIDYYIAKALKKRNSSLQLLKQTTLLEPTGTRKDCGNFLARSTAIGSECLAWIT